MKRHEDSAVAVRIVDIAQRLAPLTDVCGYGRIRAFVFDDGVLVGSVDIGNARQPVSALRLREAIGAGLSYPLMTRALEKQLGLNRTPELAAGVSVSVVIPTCNRPDDLRRCLTALRRQRSPRGCEIVVIDNRPGPDSPTPSVAREFPEVRFIDEPRPGLSYARNAGFAASTGDILIAIDDDVVVPEGWLDRLIAPFARPEVMAVTGHVLPLELETRSQCDFEAYGGLGKGFNRFEVDGEWFRSLRGAVPTWHLGATANAAFRAAIFDDPRIGMLDEALGAGMPTGCSEDTYLFYRILKAGHTIVYEPTAFVWHRHRRTDEALRHQIHCYSKGHVAYHLTTLLRDGDRRALVRLGYSLPKTYLRRAYARLRRRSDYPLHLILTEIAGTLAGPWALWQSRRRVRRFGPGARSSRHHAVPMESSLTQTTAT
jgi:GT2 family glycosyltransferase